MLLGLVFLQILLCLICHMCCIQIEIREPNTHETKLKTKDVKSNKKLKYF